MVASAVTPNKAGIWEVLMSRVIASFLASGRGFYQLNKPELIQDYKEIVVRRRSDEKIVSGDKVREVLARRD